MVTHILESVTQTQLLLLDKQAARRAGESRRHGHSLESRHLTKSEQILKAVQNPGFHPSPFSSEVVYQVYSPTPRCTAFLQFFPSSFWLLFHNFL